MNSQLWISLGWFWFLEFVLIESGSVSVGLFFEEFVLIYMYLRININGFISYLVSRFIHGGDRCDSFGTLCTVSIASALVISQTCKAHPLWPAGVMEEGFVLST